jgi:hypothetical protein
LAAALALALAAGVAHAQCDTTQTTRFGGSTSHVTTIDSNRVLIASGTNLDIYNVSTPGSMFRTGTINVGEAIGKMKVISGRAYVITGEGIGAGTTETLRVYSVSGAAPSYLFDLYQADQLDFDSSGSSIFVGSHQDSAPRVKVTAISMAFPDTPLLQGEYDIPSTADWYTAVSLSVSGSRAFVSFDRTNLSELISIVSIANPNSMTQVGSYSGAQNTILRYSTIVASGNTAYACRGDQVEVLGLSSLPSVPLQQTVVTEANDAAILGTTLFLASGKGGVRAYNIAAPSNPIAYAPFNTIGASNDIIIIGDRLYNADRDGGLSVLQIGNPSSITQLGVIPAPAPSNVQDITNTGSTLFVLDDLALRTYSLANPDAPSPLGQYVVPDATLAGCGARLVRIHNNNAYLTGCDRTLLVLNVTNPAAPTFRAQLNNFDADYDTAFFGNFAYCAGFDGLKIVNIANPSAPSLVSTYAFGGGVYSVEIQGSLAFVGTFSFGLWILDLSNPTSPQLIGQYDTPGRGACYGMQVNGPTVYLARNSGLEIYDVSNPSNPTLLSFSNNINPTVGQPLTYRNGMLHMLGVVDFVQGSHLIDVSNRSAPVTVGSFPGYFLAQDVVGSRLFLGDADRKDLRIASIQSQWKPAFRTQPTNTQTCLHGNIALNSSVSANPASVSYQWRRNNIPLAPHGRYIGIDAPTLIIVDIAREDAGNYTCVATNSCGSTTSAAAALTICEADFNCDGTPDFFDYLDFAAAFDANHPIADFNADGSVDFFDYLDFAAAFDAGC